MRMIARKLSLYALTAWVAITVNFLLPRMMPGNPVQTLIGRLTGRVTPQQVHAIELSFGIGLHQDLFHQYTGYISQLFQGNLGVSITLASPVSTILRAAVPWTVGLIGISTIISFVIGTLHWFPVLGAYSPNLIPNFSWTFIYSLIRYGELPVITIVLSSIAGWMLGMRNMMITMIGEDFVLMAVAKGLPRRKVIMHAARNAVLPSIANLSLAIGLVVSGALLVELVFNYPGVGNLLLQAVLNEDYPLIQGIFLVITMTVLAANLIADLVYLALDPRTRTEAAV